jgi:hypothetical protein
MHRRGFLLLSVAALIGAMANKSRNSAEARQKDEHPDYLTREQHLALSRIDDLYRENAALIRELEVRLRSAEAQLALAKAVAAQIADS